MGWADAKAEVNATLGPLAWDASKIIMLLYDAEIRKCIPTKEARDPRYQYCNGWTDFTRMEIGIICAYDYEKDWWHVFGNDNREDFWDLVRRHDKVVGHGSQTFDDKLVQACWPHNPMFRDDQCWDLNQAVRTSCGKFLKMNDLAMKNLGWGQDRPWG